MKINPLHALLPKIKIIKEPPDHTKEAGLRLREYFKMFHKRRKIVRVIPNPPKYTLFLEPFPYLLPYIEEDEKYPLKREFYSSFRVVYRRYMNALKEHKKVETKKNRASLIK